MDVRSTFLKIKSERYIERFGMFNIHLLKEHALKYVVFSRLLSRSLSRLFPFRSKQMKVKSPAGPITY